MLIQVFITVGISQALVLALLLCLKKGRKTADLILAMELTVMFIISILYNYRNEIREVVAVLPLHAYVLGYLGALLFYLYVKAVVQGELQWRWKRDSLHLLPFGIAMLLLSIYYYPLSRVEQLAQYDMVSSSQAPLWFELIYYGLFLGVFPYYLYQTYLLLQKHEHYILTKFSYKEDIGLEWLNRFFWIELITWGAFMIFEVLGQHWLVLLGDWGLQLGFIFMMLGIMYLGVYGLREHPVFVQQQEEPAITTNPAAGLAEEKANDYLDQLSSYMLREKPFLAPKISIAELSHRTGIPVNHLSKIINEQLGLNFFDFINSYRVEEFKRLVSEAKYEHFTLLGLAFEAGFNSKSTFNAIFKKFTQQTPSEYIRNLQTLPIAGSSLS